MRYLALIGTIFISLAIGCRTTDLHNAQPVPHFPSIQPDYINVTLPPNIAPINFVIDEDASQYVAEISSQRGEHIRIVCNDGRVRIPAAKWRRLLQENAGEKLNIDIYVKTQNTWRAFKTIVNPIAPDPVDSHLVYRLIEPQFTYWNEMGIYQRNVQTFEEKPVLENRATGNNCMNCHTFCQNNPDRMLFHLRGGRTSGTIFRLPDKLVKVNTGTDAFKAGAYASWHPDGRLVAFASIKLTQFFHARGDEIRDVLDWGSDIIIYDIEQNKITTQPTISRPDLLETFPGWSADGRTLYFCRALAPEHFIREDSTVEKFWYKKVKFDIVKIAYNPENDEWGDVEMVVSSKKYDKTCLIPRVSPDGRFMAFNMAQYGNFPVFRSDNDIYILNLQTGEINRPEFNSNQVDAYHQWSSNSHWLIFSSKRTDGLCAHPYFVYVDDAGNFHKPFVLPQKDPSFYDSFLYTYNLPEPVNGPVKTSPQKFLKTALNNEQTYQAILDPDIKVEAKEKFDDSGWKPAPK